MRKKWLFSVTLAAGLIAIPSVGFSAAKTTISPNQITLESGGVGVPLGWANEFFPGLYHLPTDGIIAGVGNVGGGCLPDVHEFNKSTEGEHIIFTAGVSEFTTNADAAAFLDDFTIYVEITSNGEKVLELPFDYHVNPETGEGVDPNTGKPFWVKALYFNEAYPGATVVDLPTGEYNYQFKAIANGKNGHVLDVWVPKDHKFTIIDN